MCCGFLLAFIQTLLYTYVSLKGKSKQSSFQRKCHSSFTKAHKIKNIKCAIDYTHAAKHAHTHVQNTRTHAHTHKHAHTRTRTYHFHHTHSNGKSKVKLIAARMPLEGMRVCACCVHTLCSVASIASIFLELEETNFLESIWVRSPSTSDTTITRKKKFFLEMIIMHNVFFPTCPILGNVKRCCVVNLNAKLYSANIRKQ